MKAKVKETGQIIEIKDNCSIIDYARGIYTEKLSGRRFHDYELEFIYKENKNIDWELRRYEIARTVLHSFIGKKYYDWRSENYVEYTEKEVACLAVRYTDALIEELKKGK